VAISLKKQHVKVTIDQNKFLNAKPVLSKLLKTAVEEFGT